jgi:NADPH:quinone reductase-like Zn-dependent oxidoreductase
MKAIVREKYGSPDVLELRDVVKPAPLDNKVLVEVHAASVNALDWHLLRGQPFLARMGGGMRRPKRKTLGVDVAGRVESVGKNVTKFKPGDEVFGGASGSFAEYACAREDLLAHKPTNMTFEEAAAVPVAAITALQGLRDKGQIQPGKKVLINGASGGVGTFAVQIAKSFGAEVTAVCSAKNLEIARSMGADHVIDYSKEDLTKNGQRYDLIVAVNGHHPIRDYGRALSPKGIFVFIGGPVAQFFQALIFGPMISRTGSKKMITFVAELNNPDMLLLKELLETGKLVPVIDRRYPLAETAEAIRYLEEGHARGKVVITVERDARGRD